MTVAKWIRISLINLLIVSLLGVIMRYKILYSLPFIQQKHILHAHSHFAFAGWLSLILMALMVEAVGSQKNKNLFPKYNILLFSNLLAAYGILISFTIQGYGLFSISFSTFSIFIFYFFAVRLWNDINSIDVKQVNHLWFKAALLFNIISSIGAFALAFLISNKTIHQNWYLAAVYFFLHFQYNGWFLFACLGLLFHQLQKVNIRHASFIHIFWMFGLACVPAYFLSTLWMNLPNLIYAIVIIAAIIQAVGWILFIRTIKIIEPLFSTTKTKIPIVLFSLSAVALSIKILLQLMSTIPQLSDVAFGFRPIVIGYLHLVLLGIITLFILGYYVLTNPLLLNNTNKKGIAIFTIAVIVNEFLLLLQGVTFMGYIVLPFVNEALLFTALLLFAGIFMMNLNSNVIRVIHKKK
ncbi:MAG: hypothetical protein MUE72_08745 [Chitinophagaceae bacterium]|jgi:hypothetical protein|nr:hypothetical protein [Chitinophagaceae bacterium]